MCATRCLATCWGALFRFAGHEVEIQNYIDDTGKQVADMLFGLEYLGLLGPGGVVEVPADRKLDHFFGDTYVRINRLVEDGELPKEAFEAGSARYAHAREAGEYRDLVRAIVLAQLATAWRLGIFYDILSWEGDVVQGGLFDEAMQKLLATNAAYHQTEGRHAGCVVIEMGDFLPEGAGETADDHPTERVLIRSNGLPTYTAKDIAYHMWKYRAAEPRPALQAGYCAAEWRGAVDQRPGWRAQARQPADEVINADRRAPGACPEGGQSRAAGRPATAAEAAIHHHLGYGVVSPSGGSFSGRKGTEYSADAVLDAVVAAQYERSLRQGRERGIEVPEQELRATSELVAVASLRYLMCRFDPLEDITFTIEDVIDEKGTTALYIQYAYARMQSIFRKGGYEAQMHGDVTPWDAADLALLIQPQEQALIRVVARLPFAVAQAVERIAYPHPCRLRARVGRILQPLLRSLPDPPLRCAARAEAGPPGPRRSHRSDHPERRCPAGPGPPRPPISIRPRPRCCAPIHAAAPRRELRALCIDDPFVVANLCPCYPASVAIVLPHSPIGDHHARLPRRHQRRPRACPGRCHPLPDPSRRGSRGAAPL